MQFVKEGEESYEITDKVITAIIDRIIEHMKDFKYERDESKWELEDNLLPIYAIIYFWVRAGKRNEAIRVAEKSKLHVARLISDLLKEENIYIEGNGENAGLPDNDKLYQTALSELSNISKRMKNDQGEDNSEIYKKDIFKEALLILLTKSSLPSNSLLNSNLSDYLWFNLQKWWFEMQDTDINYSNKNVMTLKILQNIILTHGESHFNENGQSPLNFYKVLIFVGLYKEAISYLDKIDQHRVENTHVAISLNELGILSLGENDKSDGKPLNSLKSQQKVENNIPLFVTIMLNFLDFLGAEYFPESIIYSTLLDESSRINIISDLFVKNNSFSILIESTDKTGLNLKTKKNLQLSVFLYPETIKKIIKKVCKKVNYSTRNPDIQILLQNKIGNDQKVVDLIIQKQNLLIEDLKPSILKSKISNVYTEDELMKTDGNLIPSVWSNFKPIIEKIQNKAVSGSIEHQEIKRRLENIDAIVQLFNLVKSDNYDKAYTEMKNCQFLPLKDAFEPNISLIDQNTLLHLPDLILLCFIVLKRKLKDASHKQIDSVHLRFYPNESSDVGKLKTQMETLKVYYTKVEKMCKNKMTETNSENTKKIENLKWISKEISSILLEC